MNYVLILAGGNGVRFGNNDTPKQFALIDNRTVLEHAIDAFEKCGDIDRIFVVMNEKYLTKAQELIQRNSFAKFRGMVEGGISRFESSFAGLKRIEQDLEELNEKSGKVLIHDAARAYVTPEVIKSVVDALDSSDAVQPIVPVAETIVQKIDGRWQTQNRDDFATVQTPQGFCFNKIYDAYMRAVNNPLTSWTPTDDISVLSEYSRNAKISVVAGDHKNRKITYSEDLR
ncbi:MAG: 2-C-methyl-D-erythritol 4-phosphate cytidylyltransferase [Candidatus Ancillula sp.]|jgi:2-C-methyl-D-erythritol 4-phosphate cytidylyltransferase|nr:2-C-methyl-D-erythritol 4-phosphate cytidylyltransferase [Candidatus Ancillula sp.]